MIFFVGVEVGFEFLVSLDVTVGMVDFAVVDTFSIVVVDILSFACGVELGFDF